RPAATSGSRVDRPKAPTSRSRGSDLRTSQRLRSDRELGLELREFAHRLGVTLPGSEEPGGRGSRLPVRTLAQAATPDKSDGCVGLAPAQPSWKATTMSTTREPETTRGPQVEADPVFRSKVRERLVTLGGAAGLGVVVKGFENVVMLFPRA